MKSIIIVMIAALAIGCQNATAETREEAFSVSDSDMPVDPSLDSLRKIIDRWKRHNELTSTLENLIQELENKRLLIRLNRIEIFNGNNHNDSLLYELDDLHLELEYYIKGVSNLLTGGDIDEGSDLFATGKYLHNRGEELAGGDIDEGSDPSTSPVCRWLKIFIGMFLGVIIYRSLKDIWKRKTK